MVNLASLIMHVSEPFLLFNLLEAFWQCLKYGKKFTKLKLIKFGTFISFETLLKFTNTCIHVRILNKLLLTGNANEYDLNYTMLCFKKHK